MITFKPLASSSKGNCYLVMAPGTQPLLLDAGIPIKHIREKLTDYKVSISDLAGCLIDHEHLDHSKAVKDLIKVGVDCYMSRGTAMALDIDDHYRVCFLEKNKLHEILGTTWEILPFALKHDASEPLGFLIAHGDERLLFIPDTAYIKNRFIGITIAAIECNFIGDILSENIRNGLSPVIGHRIRHSHMSLETAMEMLKANDLSKCREIWLLHLSNSNSDEVQMKCKIQELMGIPVYIAKE